MAFNSQIKGYMTFGKSFSRGGAFPLEAYEIWTDYDALVAYAANTDPAKDPSYIGQKVAYVDLENNKVTHYGIEIDGSLKELGASPIGDEKSIVIGDDNTISLKGIDGLTFERDILGEDGQPTGQKENVQFQPLMTKDGLIWVEPSKTTVEGLASLIDGLTARVSALENDRVTEQELADAVKAETDRATAAEEALGKRIDDIDFVDADELATAISGVEAKIPTNNNQLENGAGYQTANDVSTAIANKADKADTLAGYGITDAYTQTQVDSLIAGITHFTTQVVTDISDVTDPNVLYLIKSTEVEGNDNYDEYLFIESMGAVKIGDTTTDLTNYVTNDALAEAIKEFVTNSSLASTLEPYAKTADVNAALADKADSASVVAKSDFETFQTTNTQAIADARSGAVSDVEAKGYAVASEVASTYATKQFVGEIPEDADATTIVGYINEKAQEVLDSATGGSSESAASVKQQLDSYKATNDPKVNALLSEVYGALAEGETDYNYAADSRIDALEKADTAQDALIASNTALAQQGVDDAAAAALAVTNLTSGQVAQNKNDIAAVKEILNGEDNENSHAKRIAKLEAHDLAHAEEYTALNTKVGENTTAISKKADAENVYTKSEADVLINAKANAADVYVKGDVYTKTETDNAIAAAVAGADLSSYAKVTDVEAIYKAGVDGGAATGVLADEIARATAAEQANSDAIAAIVGTDSNKTIRAIAKEEVATIVGAAPEALNTLEEVANWIANDESGAAAMANDIAALKGTVGDASSGLVKAVADNTAAIAAIIQPKASEEITVAEDGTLGLGKVSTDKLVMGENTLIIDGGSAVE